MKKEIKYFWIILFVIAFLGILISLKEEKQEELTPINCSKPLEVVYITKAELSHASEIADKINGVVVIPEENQLIARNEVLTCPSFIYKNYILGFEE